MKSFFFILLLKFLAFKYSRSDKATQERLIKSQPMTERTVYSCLPPPCKPRHLGPFKHIFQNISLPELNKKFPQVHRGGRYKPINCFNRESVAIIVPYRNRLEHLIVFLSHMHPFLMKQEISYRIFIIEQAGDDKFNRAKLLNVGYIASQKMSKTGYQCLIFHDVDYLPVNTLNMYTCASQPKSLARIFDGKGTYNEFFGAVSALTLDQMEKVNGFSNKYWGWGGEDDDMANRLKKFGFKVTKSNETIAMYISLPHKVATFNPQRHEIMKKGASIESIRHDGLSTLKYRLVKVDLRKLFTHVIANISENKKSGHKQ